MPSTKPQIRVSELHREALYKLGASLGRTASKQLELILDAYFEWHNKQSKPDPPPISTPPPPPATKPTTELDFRRFVVLYDNTIKDALIGDIITREEALRRSK